MAFRKRIIVSLLVISLFAEIKVDGFKPLIDPSVDINNTIYQVTNRSLLCNILNGSCVSKSLCQALRVKAVIKQEPSHNNPNFTCDEINTCCFHSMDSQPQPKSQSIVNVSKSSVDDIIGGIENKTSLCGVLGGKCTDSDKCQMLLIKDILDGADPGEKYPQFNCSTEETCCFAGSGSAENEIGVAPVQVVKTQKIEQEPDHMMAQLREIAALLTRQKQPKFHNIQAAQSQRNYQKQIPFLPSRFPPNARLRQQTRFKNSYDYDYGHGAYNYRPNNYRRQRAFDYDFDDYDYYQYRRPVRRQLLLPPREPLSRLYHNSAMRQMRGRQIRPKAGYNYGKRVRKYKPRVIKKIQYHDHNHGHSLLNHGIGGVYAKGLGDVFVSNLTAFCEIYDGVCVEPWNCATESGKSYNRFQCNATTLCCLPDYSIKRLHPLGQKSDKGKIKNVHSDKTRHLLLSRIDPENSALFTATDRETLCDLKNGTCIHPSLCNSHKEHEHGHGYNDPYDLHSLRNTYNSHHDFYCNLTSICCVPSLFETHVEVLSYKKYKKRYH